MDILEQAKAAAYQRSQQTGKPVIVVEAQGHYSIQDDFALQNPLPTYARVVFTVKPSL